jgi:hypothetical protein
MTNKNNDRDWNIFSLSKTSLWKRFFHKLMSVVTPRFLYEVIIPQDVLNIINEIKFPEKSVTNGKANADPAVFRFILACAIFNGILIGVPGTAGWGVFAAQAVEVLMAVQIARMVGLLDVSIFAFQKILKLFSATALATVSVVYFFKKALSIVFNLLSNFVPYGFTTATAEIVTTLFFGLFLYLSFIEIENFDGNRKNKTVSFSMLPRIIKNTTEYTVQISKSLFKLIETDAPRLFGEIKHNVRDAWYGVVDVKPRLKGEIFLVGCLAYLLDGKEGGLKGPFAELWLEAWRKSFPSKLGVNSSVDDIRDIASSYDPDALEQVMSNNVVPKFFEILETTEENADGDVWSAELLEGQNHPVSDAIFFNSKTGQSIEINYKFSENLKYIKSHIQLHPDVPVIASADVAEKINSPLVFGGHFDYADIVQINEQNFERFLELNQSLYLEDGAVGSGALSLVYYLLPFSRAYYKGDISREQFASALKKFIPEVTGRTINRIAMMSLLGPIYGSFLIASYVGRSTLYDFDDEEKTNYKEDLNENNSEEDLKTNKQLEPIPKPRKKFSRRDIITLSFLKEIN